MTYDLKSLTKDVFTGNVRFASDEVIKQRYALCNACPHLRRNIVGHRDQSSQINGEKCNLCGCYMPVKTKLVKASCPAKKW